MQNVKVNMENVKVNMERTSVNTPGPEPISGILDDACNLAVTALEMAMRINAHCFGIQPKDGKELATKCMRDVMSNHVECLKAICAELEDIMHGLGV